jgi:hypothetical protein
MCVSQPVRPDGSIRSVRPTNFIGARDSNVAMFADSQKHLRLLKLKPRSDWTTAWHMWTVFIPRRSITGRLVHGQVWRRHDGRKWIYKKFVEYV